MSQKSSFKPSFEALEARDVPSVTTESLRIPDSSNPDVVAITRQTQYNLSTAITPQGTQDYFAFYNGGELLNMTGRALGLENTLGVGSEGSPETVRVTPSFTMQVIGNNQLQISWQNMRVMNGPAWIRAGWLGDRIIWHPEGSTILNVPWTGGDPKFDQVYFEISGMGAHFAGLTYRITQGRFDQNPPTGNFSFPGQFGWNRVLPNPDVDWLAARSLNTRNIASTTWATDEVFLHPEANKDMVMTWTSPAAGSVDIAMLLRDMQPAMGDGATYTLQKVPATGETTLLSSGLIQDGATVEIGRGVLVVQVAAGDKLQLTLNGRGTNNDAANVRGDMHKITFNPILTETEKTYEKVTVAPSIQLRANPENSALFVDFRNMPGDVTLRARARHHLQQTREIALPQGSGSKWINLNGMYPTDGPVPIDVHLLTAQSDGLPVQEKKLTFTAQLTNGNPVITQVPNVREYFGALANDVLRQMPYEKSAVDLAEELAVPEYLQYRTTPPARDWTDGKVFDYGAKAHQFGVLTQSDLMNEPLVGNNSLHKILIPTSTTKYERHSLITDGSVEIVRVHHIKEDGLYKVPHEYYDRLPGGGIITKPTISPWIVLEIRLTGGLRRASVQADTSQELQLPSGQLIIGHIERINPQPVDQPGWRNMVLDIPQGQSAVLPPGTTVGVFAQISNAGSEGGMITVKTYCGYTGNTAQDQLQNTFTKYFGPNQQSALFFSATAPLPGPGSDARGIITMEATYPDGHKEIISSRLTRWLNIDPVELAAQNAARKKAYDALPMYDRDGKTVIGMGGVLFSDKKELAFQYMKLYGQAPVSGSESAYDLALSALGGLEANGVGGGIESSPANVQTLQRSLARYTDGLNLSGVNARTETLMGRVLLGAISQIIANPSISSQQPIFRDLSEITGIAELKIARAARLMAIDVKQDKYTRNVCPSVEVSKAQLVELFTYAGFASAFGQNSNGPVPGIVSAHIGKPDYTLVDRDVVIRLNMSSSLGGYDTLKVYAKRANGNLVSTPVAMSGASGAMYIKVPVETLLGALGSNQPQHTSLVLKAQKNSQTYQMESIGIIIERGAVLDLSTYSESPERKAAEDKILTQIAQNFPLDNPGMRRWTIGSAHHDGDEYNSIDLNRGAGDADRGDSVKAVAGGKIRIASNGSYSANQVNDLKYGAVVIEHNKAMGFQLNWKSIYLHMPIFATGRVTPDGKPIFEVRHDGKAIELWDGKEVKTGEEIGFVGGRFGINTDGSYNEGPKNAHLHFLAKYNGIGIDLRKGIFQAGLRAVKAFDAGLDGSSGHTDDGRWLDVTWNDAMKMWVNEDNKLVFDRREQLPSSPGVTTNCYWLAWEKGKSIEQMKRVVWDKARSEWFMWDINTNDWAINSDHKKIKWAKVNDTFGFSSDV